MPLFVNKLLIWILALLLYACSAHGFLNCSSCTNGDSLLCPNYTDFQFELKMLPYDSQLNAFMLIKCSNNPEEVDFSVLKGCSFSSVISVRFELCPLTNESFKETFAKIGLRSENINQISVYYPLTGVSSLHADYLNGLPNLTFLNLESTFLTHLSEDIFIPTPNLKTLHLRGNNLPTLAKNTFRPLTNLIILNLSHNNISFIPNGLFDNQQKLERLYFWMNSIEILPKNIFSNLTSLKNITFLANKLSSLDSDLFRHTSQLENVDFKKNKLQNLPENLFRNCTNLITVNFSNNKIEIIPEKLFEFSKQIKSLDFKSNILHTLSNSIFMSLNSLNSVQLSKNNIKSLPDNLFKENKELEMVDISHNQITTLPSGLFNASTNLKAINLNNNSLTSLPDYIFHDCIILQELSINRNNLSTIHFNNFPKIHNSKLKTVDLSHNYLNTQGIMPDGIFALNAQIELEYIDFSYNIFEYYPSDASFYNFLKLKNLNFERNFFKTISLMDIYDLANNTELNLKHNELEKIQNYKNLERKQVSVLLEGNNFTCDCHMFEFVKAVQHQPELSRLSYQTVSSQAYDNAVVNIIDRQKLVCQRPEAFQKRTLASIDLFELLCKMPKKLCSLDCPCSYRPYDYMIIVECSNQGMTAMPIVTFMPNYNYTLDMSGNDISHFNLSTYDLIVNLSLVGNNITMKDLENNSLPSRLKFLDLRRNSLHFLSENFITEINTTRTRVDLTQNPWICDCNIKLLHNYIHEQYAKVENIRNVQCKEKDIPMVDLTEEDICPLLLQPMILITIGVVTALLILFAVLGTVSFYRYKTRIKVWLFTHRMCLWLVTEDELDNNKQYDAFISYSHKDEEFVNNILVPGLENGDPKYRVCLHYRDWIVGEFIQNQIMNSVQSSRRTLVILSSNFIESVWGQMEFRAAHQQALQDKTNRVIVIVYGEMPPEETLDEELRHYIALHTYVKWGSPRFWESLRYAMPHPKHLLARRKRNRKEMDKIELVNGHTKQAIRV